MVLDIGLFRGDKGGNPDLVRKSQQNRFASVDLVQEVIDADALLRETRYKWEMKKAELGKLQKEIGMRAKEKKPFDDLKAQKSTLEQEIALLEPQVGALQIDLDKKINKVGNIVHSSVLVSKNEDENPIVRTWGPMEHKTTFLAHYDVLAKIDGYDPERGVKVAGNRGYFLKGAGFRLNQALISYGVDFLMKRGYTPLQTPFFMNKDIMGATAQLEDFDEQLYKVVAHTRHAEDSSSSSSSTTTTSTTTTTNNNNAAGASTAKPAAKGKQAQAAPAPVNDDEEKYLIATSEQPISAMHKDEYFDEGDLPVKYAGYSTCFRKEAGSVRDGRGIFRVHQFEKVEQFTITHPEKSWEMHEEMIKQSEEFYQSLGISYRVVTIVSGALNNAASKKYDLEGWFPAFGGCRELVSCSNCTDYQSRSLNVRLRGKKDDKAEHKYVHMLNSTLCATTRTVSIILETNQTETGVVVPEVLRPYMGGQDFIPWAEKKDTKPKETK
eukprot:TRINITY_DN542_c0_g1_i1.p1 TRINITY_DN542_c0_g1~~TRINITY_DN542_c0_g1_i1.p1  ORF type:complete len:495 (+),score=165.22 TRINITY_DN542_c0_g1_i1:88-1572(+)